MLDDSPPGASLEAPETFQILQAPVWPRLPVALGYTGGARWVALFQRGNQTRWHDGESSAAVSDAGLFLAYRRHPKISVHLAGAHLGSDDEEADTWLVLDTLQQLCYLASPDAARLFLARQWPRDTRIPALEYSPNEPGRLMTSLDEPTSQANRQARWAEALRERQANYRWMLRWLDGLPG